PEQKEGISKPDSRPSPFAVVRSDTFKEKALLLLLTAVLSGVCVPWVVKSIDEARESRAAVSRAQAKLFDDISETILTYETLVLDVSWFGTKEAKNAEMQRKAFERYSEKVVELVAKWRAQASRAQTLASKSTAAKLDKLLERVFFKQDTPTNKLWTCDRDCNWQKQHEENIRMLGEANRIIEDLARDLGLVKS
ncbi:hypothetical protein, partial [Variovorax sp. dw_308]|uniref:hypothetical protein n=1 Tax=Variovorax sp. dw_308 TaxID=2721546 RepID=UPI001C43FB4B